MLKKLDKKVYEQRISKVVEKISESQLDACILTKPANLRYLTGVRSHVFPELTLILNTSRNVALVAPEYEIDRVSSETWIENIVPYSYTSEQPLFEDRVCDVANQMGILEGKIGIEKDFVSTETDRKWRAKLSRAEFSSVTSLLEEVRMIKAVEEISLLKEASRLVDLGAESAINVLKPGVTELEVAAAAEEAMRVEGSEGVPFPSIIASGKRTFSVHAYPSKKKIRRAELVIVDIGSNYEGYLGDITRVACAGKPSEKQKRLFEVVLESMESAKECLKPGVRAHEIDMAAKKPVREEGYESAYFYPTGRGVGLEIHERPWCRKGDETVIREGMVLGLFPGIYFKEHYGFRLEDMVHVTSKGARYLTKYERRLIVC